MKENSFFDHGDAVWQLHHEKQKTVSTESLRHQLDEGTLGDPMTLFGKDDDPFKAVREDRGPSFTAVSNQPAQRPDVDAPARALLAF